MQQGQSTLTDKRGSSVCHVICLNGKTSAHGIKSVLHSCQSALASLQIFADYSQRDSIVVMSMLACWLKPHLPSIQ